MPRRLLLKLFMGSCVNQLLPLLLVSVQLVLACAGLKWAGGVQKWPSRQGRQARKMSLLLEIKLFSINQPAG